EALVVGWDELIQRRSADRQDVAIGRDMLKVFRTDLEVANKEKARAENLLKKRFRDFFIGAKGRRPYNDDELDDWLVSAEGKAATALDPTRLPALSDARRRSYCAPGRPYSPRLAFLAQCWNRYGVPKPPAKPPPAVSCAAWRRQARALVTVPTTMPER